MTAAKGKNNLAKGQTALPTGVAAQLTGDPELAGFENQSTPDRKLTQTAQNAAFRDNYLNLPFDLSKVLFIATLLLVALVSVLVGAVTTIAQNGIQVTNSTGTISGGLAIAFSNLSIWSAITEGVPTNASPP